MIQSKNKYGDFAMKDFAFINQTNFIKKQFLK